MAKIILQLNSNAGKILLFQLQIFRLLDNLISFMFGDSLVKLWSSINKLALLSRGKVCLTASRKKNKNTVPFIIYLLSFDEKTEISRKEAVFLLSIENVTSKNYCFLIIN